MGTTPWSTKMKALKENNTQSLASEEINRVIKIEVIEEEGESYDKIKNTWPVISAVYGKEYLESENPSGSGISPPCKIDDGVLETASLLQGPNSIDNRVRIKRSPSSEVVNLENNFNSYSDNKHVCLDKNKLLQNLLKCLDECINEDKFDVLGKLYAIKLRSISDIQCIYAEKLISDIIFKAQLGQLSYSSILSKTYSNNLSRKGATFVKSCTQTQMTQHLPPHLSSLQEQTSPSERELLNPIDSLSNVQNSFELDKYIGKNGQCMKQLDFDFAENGVMQCIKKHLKKYGEQDKFDKAGKFYSAKMKSIPNNQCVYAEKLINEALLKAELGYLDQTVTLINAVPSYSVSNKISTQQPANKVVSKRLHEKYRLRDIPLKTLIASALLLSKPKKRKSPHKKLSQSKTKILQDQPQLCHSNISIRQCKIPVSLSETPTSQSETLTTQTMITPNHPYKLAKCQKKTSNKKFGTANRQSKAIKCKSKVFKCKSKGSKFNSEAVKHHLKTSTSEILTLQSKAKTLFHKPSNKMNSLSCEAQHQSKPATCQPEAQSCNSKILTRELKVVLHRCEIPAYLSEKPSNQSKTINQTVEKQNHQYNSLKLKKAPNQELTNIHSKAFKSKSKIFNKQLNSPTSQMEIQKHQCNTRKTARSKSKTLLSPTSFASSTSSHHHLTQSTACSTFSSKPSFSTSRIYSSLQPLSQATSSSQTSTLRASVSKLIVPEISPSLSMTSGCQSSTSVISGSQPLAVTSGNQPLAVTSESQPLVVTSGSQLLAVTSKNQHLASVTLESQLLAPVTLESQLLAPVTSEDQPMTDMASLALKSDSSSLPKLIQSHSSSSLPSIHVISAIPNQSAGALLPSIPTFPPSTKPLHMFSSLLPQAPGYFLPLQQPTTGSSPMQMSYTNFPVQYATFIVNNNQE